MILLTANQNSSVPYTMILHGCMYDVPQNQRMSHIFDGQSEYIMIYDLLPLTLQYL